MSTATSSLARVAELMRIAQMIKRGKAAYVAKGVCVEFANPAAVADVFEACVIPRIIASELWRYSLSMYE